MTQPVYLTLPEGALRQACLESFDDQAVTPVALDQVGRDEAARPGVVLLAPDQVGVGELLALADRLYEGAEEWRFAVVRPGTPPTVHALSVGYPEELEAVATGAPDPASNPGVLMEVRGLLKEISRARHDINNPLTSALAEVQLLLMDVPEEDGEVREGLDVIQTQLRRIRDLVADTGHIRPPRRR